MTIAAQIHGKQIEKASSSLTCFTCTFSDGTGLVLEAVESESPKISGRVVDANAITHAADAVCKVDWSWIYQLPVLNAQLTDTSAQLVLEQVGPLTISVQLWQGKPFLAFQPYRPAR